MKNMIDVRNLLKKYHSFIYTGDQRTDLELMMIEIKTLYDNKLLSIEEYQEAMLVIRQSKRNLHV